MPIRDYLKFVAANLRFVTFGFFLAFASSFGQTFFIGTFGPAIQMEFSLSHTAWGTIYLVGTLGSAALLPWTGKQIDRFDLRPYTALVCILLTIACGFTAFVTTGVMLVFAIFLLRQSGQGLMSHIAITSMARYFDRDRGRAVAIATLGFSTGEAFLPFLAVFAISVYGWRWAYGGIAILLAVGLIPCVFWLLRDYDKRHQAYLARINAPVTPRGAVSPFMDTHGGTERYPILFAASGYPRPFFDRNGHVLPPLEPGGCEKLVPRLDYRKLRHLCSRSDPDSIGIRTTDRPVRSLPAGFYHVDAIDRSNDCHCGIQQSMDCLALPYLNRHQCRRRPYSRIGYVGGSLWRSPSWGDQKPGISAQCLCLGFGPCDRRDVDGLGGLDRTSLSYFFRLRGLRGSPYYRCAYAP